MTTIAVIGATGFAGGAIASEALARGYDVIAAARDTASIGPAEHQTTRDGDVFDAAFVDSLAEDADVVVVAVPHHGPDRDLVEAVPALADAVRQHHRRLGWVGGAGSLRVGEDGPLLMETPDFHEAWKPEARAGYQALDALTRTTEDVSWFYVSPSAAFGRLADVGLRGTYRLGGDILLTEPDGTSSISGPDFAQAFVDEIASPTHFRERFTVGY
ncbi:NAD(P)H-binding protein [Mumia zhuanghuii]|uniref:NAD(P)-dependent oxidoreductase n=2 Tax=Mumia TaxID=1546255 RepID=A0ABW1QIF7_9ACTN|nr:MULTISPECIES: NAD(P)H-binding protein [Mumia]KAA1424622.1 NAD(P)H-binding protein [Mumia zhuanghuii]